MSEKLKSLADLPRDAWREPPKQFVRWEPTAARIDALERSFRTLTTWLDARFADLVRERVPREDVKVRLDGSRTVILVRGQPRFEFKAKITMGECDGR